MFLCALNGGSELRQYNRELGTGNREREEKKAQRCANICIRGHSHFQPLTPKPLIDDPVCYN